MKIYFILLVARYILQVNSILNGIVSHTTQHLLKHQVRLISKHTNGQLTQCGGSLIHSNLVLTAALCLVDDVVESTLFFGLSDLKYISKALHLTASKNDFIIHPQFNKTSMKNDIALITLNSPIQFSATIGPIALPPRSACTSYAGKNVMISGWGHTDNSQTSPNLLQYTNVVTTNPNECARIFGSFDRNSMICADASVAGTCQGDSGGPLTMNLNGIPTVIGAVSYGAEGCEHNVNRLFTCVSNYIDWIYANSKGLL